MLIKIGTDWIDPTTIWRIAYECAGKTMCIYLSRDGEHDRSIAINATQEYVDSVAAQVNAAVGGASPPAA